MIPSIAIVSIRQQRGRQIRLWLPVFLIWLLLAPFAVIAAPFLLIVALAFRFNPFTGFAAILGVLWAMSGIHIEVESPRARVLIAMI